MPFIDSLHITYRSLTSCVYALKLFMALLTLTFAFSAALSSVDSRTLPTTVFIRSSSFCMAFNASIAASVAAALILLPVPPFAALPSETLSSFVGSVPPAVYLLVRSAYWHLLPPGSDLYHLGGILRQFAFIQSLCYSSRELLILLTPSYPKAKAETGPSPW